MTKEAPRYDFRPVSPHDLPLLESWLRQPHATAVWGDDVLASLEEIIEAAESVDTEPLIVELDGKPIAYLQVYDPHLAEDHPYQDQPFGTLGYDLTIGDASMLGKGHGSAILRQFTEQLFAEGALRVLIDPHPDNVRAIRAFTKAGFQVCDRRESLYGEVVLMVREAEDLPG